MGDSAKWLQLDSELCSMLDVFSNMVRAARIADDTEATVSKERKTPGHLPEVWTEKMMSSAFQVHNIVSDLKKSAALADATTIVTNVRNVRDKLNQHYQEVSSTVAVLKEDARSLLYDLEESYYSSTHRSLPAATALADEVSQLCQLAMEAGDVQRPT